MLQFCMVPMGMVEAAVGKVYQGHLAAAVRSNDLALIDRSKFKLALFALMLFFMVTVYLLVPFLIREMLGSEWELAIDLIFVMTPAFAIMILISPLTVAFVFQMSKTEMLGQALYWVIMMSFAVGVSYGNLMVCLYGVSFFTIVRLLCLYYLSEKAVLEWENKHRSGEMRPLIERFNSSRWLKR